MKRVQIELTEREAQVAHSALERESSYWDMTIRRDSEGETKEKGIEIKRTLDDVTEKLGKALGIELPKEKQ